MTCPFTFRHCGFNSSHLKPLHNPHCNYFILILMGSVSPKFYQTSVTELYDSRWLQHASCCRAWHKSLAYICIYSHPAIDCWIAKFDGIFHRVKAYIAFAALRSSRAISVWNSGTFNCCFPSNFILVFLYEYILPDIGLKAETAVHDKV